MSFPSLVHARSRGSGYLAAVWVLTLEWPDAPTVVLGSFAEPDLHPLWSNLKFTYHSSSSSTILEVQMHIPS